MTNRLSIYVLREFSKLLGLSIGALVVAFLTLDFFEKIRKFIGYDAAAYHIFMYFLLKLPRVIFDVSPIAILLSILLTIGILSKNNELVALKSCGVSLLKVAYPLIAGSLLLSLILLWANLSLVPKANRNAVHIKDFLIEKKAAAAVSRLDRVWLLMPDHSIYNVQMVDSKNHTLYGVTIYKLTEEFTLDAIVKAREMNYDGKSWTLREGHSRTYSKDGKAIIESFSERPLALRRVFDDFKNMELWSDEMTYYSLKRYVDRLRKSGFEAGRYAVDVQGKLALPFAAFITSLIGIALALRSSRATGLAISVGISLLIGVGYWIVYSTTVALGRSGLLAPFPAAWFANGLFLVLGVFLMMRVRQ